MKFDKIYFDVANTLLHKPIIWLKFHEVLLKYEIRVDDNELRRNHKLLSEIIVFPDRTNKEFYDHFNNELFLSMGLPLSKEVLDDIFFACKNQPWELFEDTSFLDQLECSVGIISNWDTTLKEKLSSFFKRDFLGVFVSEESGYPKPNLKMFNDAVAFAGCTPEKILYVGDSLKLDIIPARKAGMTAVLIDRLNLYRSFDGFRFQNLLDIKKIIN
jgi:FMN phosphatase YigB (HAD superfamily)